MPWAEQDQLEHPHERLIDSQSLLFPLRVTQWAPGRCSTKYLSHRDIANPLMQRKMMQICPRCELFQNRCPLLSRVSCSIDEHSSSATQRAYQGRRRTEDLCIPQSWDDFSGHQRPPSHAVGPSSTT